MTPRIHYIPSPEWAVMASRLIQRRIDEILSNKGECSVALTGGRSAERLYREWGRIAPLGKAQEGLHFYFGDERCVPPDDPRSNYGLAMRTLFAHASLNWGGVVHRMEADAEDKEAAACRYAEMLPESLDVMLLGVGEDGHIASLFPGSEALDERHRWVVAVDCPKMPNRRLTITPPVIARAESIFVLASGAEKANVLRNALHDVDDFRNFPARLVLDATWLLDVASPMAAH